MNHPDLLLEADRCVKCGICLPQCPTYTLTKDEGDSPRGRISLIQAYASGQLTLEDTQYHLDRCLSCLACEAACPSGVKYSGLINKTREIRGEKSWITKHSHKLISNRPYRKSSRLALWLYRYSGIRQILRSIGGKQLRRLDDLMPANAKVGHWEKTYPAKNKPLGRVGLFTGCVGRISDRTGLNATITVLNRLGYDVVIPTNQGCCGALQQHAGDSTTAQQMSLHNQDAFSPYGLDAIIYIASGCGAQLTQQVFSAPTWEISHFLNNIEWPAGIDLHPLPYRVALHNPCTLKHQLKLGEQPARLLSRIPQIQLTPLPEIDCCGAAGSYLLEQPTLADALRDRAIGFIQSADPEFLATSNSGCALHLASGLRKKSKKLRVLHPIELIEMSLTRTY